MAIDEITKRRREQRAAEIAQQIDPQAGGYFKRMLERAALAGMEEADKQSPLPDPSG
jgi:hypothetical protein